MSTAMNKKCAREECGKTVYPIEELKCLDKVWHKGCFKCTVCGMTLNMKSYKGYEKKPYCEPHYPKTVASAVSDTPEMRRLAENTKFQSQINYHADFEKMKGTKIDVADDPESQRHKQNARLQSQAQYHGDLNKKAQMEAHRPSSELANQGGGGAMFYESEEPTHFPTNGNGNGNGNHVVGAQQSLPRHVVSGMPTFAAEAAGRKDSPYSQRQLQEAGTVVYSSEQGGRAGGEQQQRKVGSISDYDPMNNQWGTAAGAQPQAQAQLQTQPQAEKSPTKAAAGGSSSPGKAAGGGGGGSAKAQGSPAAAAEVPVSRNTGFAVKALYDYTAADKDEVTFKENDIIVNCVKVDDGWMTGTVQRTLMWGMLPANYVEKINQPTGLFKLN